jgi:pyruvate kinase
MSRIITFMEGSYLRSGRLRERIDGQQLGIEGRAIAEAASYAAQEIRSKLIIVFTKSGSMARHLAALRPSQRIVAVTPHETTYRSLAAVWGIEPCLLDFSGRTFDLLARADEAIVSKGLAQRGETVVAMAGLLPEQPSLSSMMKLHRIGEMKSMDS